MHMPTHDVKADAGESCRKITKKGNVYSVGAPAKLNITLSIGKRESNGMHRISSVMQAVSLHDRLTLVKTEAGNVGISGYTVADNIAAKAIEELSNEVGRKLYCRINVSKSIPVAAGLGGGSSDAAAVLRLANAAFGLGMDADELSDVAQRIGNDVPFLLRGGRANVSGKNQGMIRPMRVPHYHYLIANPGMRLSTREMYAIHDKTGRASPR